MTITITLPPELSAQLERRANTRNVSAEELTLRLLNVALQDQDAAPTPEAVVKKIRATPPNPRGLRPASGSLAEALRQSPVPADFDLAVWNQAWAAVEVELAELTRANDIAENRG